MNHEELFFCISVITIISFFSLIIEIGSWRVKRLPHPSESRESAVKNEYKSPLYKLWQYVTKNKPSSHSDNTFCSNYKEYSRIQRILLSYSYSLKNCTKQSTLINTLKWLSFKSKLFLCKRHKYSVRCSHFLHIYTIIQMLAYIKSQIFDYWKYSKLDDFSLQIDKDVVMQRLEKSHRFSTYINRIFYCRVYSL